MLAASILMVIIAVLPFILGAMVYKALGKSKLSIAILVYMFFIAVWQLDIAVLYMHNLLPYSVVDGLFRFLRFGQMFLTPTFLYIFYTFAKKSKTERKIFKKWHLYVMFCWVLVTYLINWTNLGITGFKVDEWGIYRPVYGVGNITYFIYLIISYGILYMGYLETKVREHDVILKKFMRTFVYYCALLLTLGAMNFWDKVMLLAGTLGIIIFSTLIAVSLIKYNFDLLTRIRTVESRVEKPIYANDLLSSFIHEVRNPLSAFIGFTTLLPEKQELNDDGKFILDQLHLATDHMKLIVDDFVDFIRSGKITTEKKCIAEIVLEAKSLLIVKMNEKNVQLNVKVKSGPVIGSVDVGKLRQVFVNLIKNSMDAFDEHKPNKVIEISIMKNRKDYIVIDVKDNGGGIPDHVIDRLFLPKTSTKPSGFGLGLSIVNNIILAHGGTISLVNSDETGTHFVIKLPSDRFHQRLG